MRSETETEGASGSAGAEWFAGFVVNGLPRLRLALISAYGHEQGIESAADVATYAWEHRERLAGMTNPAGYLFRVGQSASRRYFRRLRPLRLPAVSSSYEEQTNPDLPAALARLSDRQRVAVILVHVNGWTYQETATALGVSPSTAQTHVARALERLSALLGEKD